MLWGKKEGQRLQSRRFRPNRKGKLKPGDVSKSFPMKSGPSPLYLLYSKNANSQANGTKQETRGLVSEQAKEFQRKEL